MPIDFCDGSSWHGLCRDEKGRGGIVSTQKDESIGEVHATQVLSCCQSSYFVSSRVWAPSRRDRGECQK